MSGDLARDGVTIFVALVAVISLSATLNAKLSVPYTETLVLVGIAASVAGWPSQLEVTPDTVLLILIPGLVFEAALRLRVVDLRATIWRVVLLAAPGVVLSALVVAAALHFVTGLDFSLGFVVGAIVSATDPVAVVSTFRRLGAPRELETLVDGESLLNDGTGLIVFLIAIRAVDGGIGITEAAVAFAGTLVLSVAIGVIVAIAASWLIALTSDVSLHLSVSILAAYGTYLVADAAGESGIIATVIAGIIVGNLGRWRGSAELSNATIDAVWGFAAFILTAIAFILIGRAISPGGLLESGPWIAAAVLGALLGRAVIVYGLVGGFGLLRRKPDRLPTPWLHVLFWAGLRGAVATAMALSLPEGFPERRLLQSVVFGVVLVSLLLHGTTAGWVVRRFGSPRRSRVAEAT